MSSTRNINLDLIKTLAMLMVLGLHINVFRDLIISGSVPLPEVYPICGIAIPLFFMTSGFLMSCKIPDGVYILRKIYGIIRFCFIICILLTCYHVAKTGSLSGGIFFPHCFLQQGLTEWECFGTLERLWCFICFCLILWKLCVLRSYLRSCLFCSA